MTVGELIEELKKYDPNLPVRTMTHLEGLESDTVLVELDEASVVIFAESRT